MGHDCKNILKPKQRQQIVHLSIGAPLRDQRNGNKSYILALGHHPRPKQRQQIDLFSHWGTTSRPRQRQQIVDLSIGAALREQSNGNKSYTSALRHHFKTEAMATKESLSRYFGAKVYTIRVAFPIAKRAHLSIGAPLRNQGNLNKIVLLGTGAPLRRQCNGNKSGFLALGHHVATKATATDRMS